MATQSKPPLNPLVEKYLLQWKKDPRGYSFAPLAEAYRRSGLIKEAMNALARGLKIHPHYVLGHLVMAECYCDEDRWEEAYKTLRPFAQIHFDNLKLQNLFAQAAYKNYSMTESLQAYKCVLFLDPHNEEVRLKIRELEENEKNYYAYLNKEKQDQNSVSFKNDKAERELQNSAENWVNVNPVKFDDEFLEDESDELSEWSVRKDNITLNPQAGMPEVIEPEDKETVKLLKNPPHFKSTIDDELVELPEVIADENEIEDEVKQSDSSKNFEDTFEEIHDGEEIPIVTHTLIDLYFAQKHYEKARELLLKVLKHDPNDERSQDKLKKIESLTGKATPVMAAPSQKSVISHPSKVAQSSSQQQTKKYTEDDYGRLAQSYSLYLKELRKHYWKQ